MPWAKLDDRFQEHPKVRMAWRASQASIGLHVMAITYCAGNLTDGFVSVAWVESQFRRERDEKAAIRALVDAGLWHETDGGWLIHDYLVHQDSRAKVEAKRERNAQNGRKGGQAKSKRTASESLDRRQPVASDLSKPDSDTDTDTVSPGGETTPRAPRPAGVVGDVLDRLRQVGEWNAELVAGADVAVAALVQANEDVPWTELAAEAVASKLDTTPGSLRTRSPRQALELRLADHRSGRRHAGATGQPTRRGGSSMEHYAAMAADFAAEEARR